MCHFAQALVVAHLAAGVQALYRGNGANVLRVVPEVMLKFSMHDQLRIIFATSAVDPAQLPLTSRIAAGSITGLFRTILFHPLSVIRTRRTADCRGEHSVGGLTGTIREMWGRERWRAFYGGFSVAAFSAVPYLTVCFAAYDSLVSMLSQDKDTVQQWWFPVAKMGSAAGAACPLQTAYLLGPLPLALSLSPAAIDPSLVRPCTGAGIAAQLVTYPVDTVRRLLEVQGGAQCAARRAGVLQMVQRIHRQEGYRGFYRGVTVNCLKTAPSTALQVCPARLPGQSVLVQPQQATARASQLRDLPIGNFESEVKCRLAVHHLRPAEIDSDDAGACHSGGGELVTHITPVVSQFALHMRLPTMAFVYACGCGSIFPRGAKTCVF